MSVEVKSQRQAVVIGWDPKGAGTDSGTEPPAEEKPPGFPAHPIVLPDEPVDPDYGVDEGAHPEHPIYLPPYIDNSLPGGGGTGIWGPTDPRPSHPIELPEDIGLSEEQKEKLKSFLTGNLPPAPQPVGGKGGKGGAIRAVQVFAQGQKGDWSNTAVMPNDGECALHYPDGFTGESYVEVRSLDGVLVDSGTISVK